MENNRFERLRPYRDNLSQERFAYTADYFYIYSNQSFTDYTVLLKVEITDSNKSAIDNFTKEIENETDRSSRAFDSWLEHFRRGKGRYSWNSIGSATYESIERVDGVDGRKIQQCPGKSTRQYDSGHTQKSSGNNKTNSQEIASDYIRKFLYYYRKLFKGCEARNQGNNALSRALETTPGIEKTVMSMNDESMQVTRKFALNGIEKSEDSWYNYNSDIAYTEEQYNSFGWARANGVLSVKENERLRSLFADAVSKQASPPLTKSGEYMIAIGENVENKIAYMKGDIDSPVITRILEIDEYDETKLDELRRETYALEGRGIQRKAGGVFNTYTRTSFRSSIIEQRGDIQGQRHNNQLGTHGGSGSRAASKTQEGVRSPYLKVVRTFTDVTHKKRNVLKVGSNYMIEGDTHGRYQPTIELTESNWNERIIKRYAKKNDRTPSFVRGELKQNPNYLNGFRFVLPKTDGKASDQGAAKVADTDKIKVSRGQYEKMKANLESDKVYSKREVVETLDAARGLLSKKEGQSPFFFIYFSCSAYKASTTYNY